MRKASTITLNNDTWASNPPAASVNPFRFAWFYPKWPLIWILLLGGSAFFVLRISIWFLLLLLPVLGFKVLYWIRIREFFAHGDANPGIVLDTNPTLVAVRTDLTKGVGSYPAIKVFRTRLSWMMGQRAQAGTRLPTVALYTRSTDANCPHWADFDPRPLECATRRLDTLQRVMASFPEAEWQQLEAGIQTLPGNKPGLYLLPKRPQPPKRYPCLVFARIMDSVGPFERRTKYAEPLDRDLQSLGWGKVAGGGTGIDKDGTREWVGIDIELSNLEDALEFTRRQLRKLGAPEGSVLECGMDGREMIVQIDGD